MQIVDFEREAWTVTDYLNFSGTLSCTEPLTLIGGGSSTLLLGPTQFQAHVLEE